MERTPISLVLVLVWRSRRRTEHELARTDERLNLFGADDIFFLLESITRELKMTAATSTAKSAKAQAPGDKGAKASAQPQQEQKQQPQTNGNGAAAEEDGGDEDDEGAVDTNGQPTTSAPKKKKKKPKKKSSSSTSASATHPLSTLDSTLPLPQGVAQHYFDPIKGKGLIATRDFQEGEDVFGDSAFVSAPPMAQAKKVEEGELCNECFQPIEAASPALVVRCRRAGASSSASGCGAAWCNRECEQRGRSKHHNLLCRTNNTASAPFLDFMAQGHAYLSLHSTARLYASILLCHSSTPPPAPYKSGETATMEDTLRHAKAFATIHEVARKRRNPGWDIEKKAWEATFKNALELLRGAIDPYEEKRLEAGGQGGIRGKGKWIVEPNFPRGVAQELFGWEGFMRYVEHAAVSGKMLRPRSC